MNPPYDAKIWAELVPRYMENLIAAARDAGARLVVLDNVYMLGRPGGRPFDEDTPPNPCSRKGEIRARAAERLFEAHRRGDVLATAGRASDFYGPGGTQTHLGDQFWPRALAGKTAAGARQPRRDPHVSLHPGCCGWLGDARLCGRRCVRPTVDASMCSGRDHAGTGGQVLAPVRREIGLRPRAHVAGENHRCRRPVGLERGRDAAINGMNRS